MTDERANIPLDVKSAEEHLMRFLAVEGVTGEEKAIAAAVADELVKVGVPASAIRYDTVHERIPLPTQCGNLYADLPGTRPGPRLLFSTHLDTVPLCAGAKPQREGDKIVGDGTTALGGDNRTGCAVLVSLVETLLKHKLPHPPITLLFTVREESGLHGARELKPADLKDATMCFNVDGQLADRADHRRGGPGKLGRRDQGQGVACRRRSGKRHLRDAGRRRSAWPRPTRPAGSARWSSPTATGRATSASLAARRANRPAMPRMS